MKNNIVIVDYGMGNIYSVLNAFKYSGSEPIYSSNEKYILNASHILLPGVGSFNVAMQNIKRLHLDDILKEAAAKQIPILGICLGMQLLGNSSTEDGFSEGLGLFDGKCELINNDLDTDLFKVPHVGFEDIEICPSMKLFNGIDNHSDFYFVHSYCMQSNIESNIATCSYGQKFIAAFENGNVMGTQFHPEKSQKNGLQLLKNFINL